MTRCSGRTGQRLWDSVKDPWHDRIEGVVAYVPTGSEFSLSLFLIAL